MPRASGSPSSRSTRGVLLYEITTEETDWLEDVFFNLTYRNGGGGMTALVRAELLKLRTLRSTAWAAAALLVITVLTGTASPWATPARRATARRSELRETVIAIGYTAVFFMVVLGAVAAAGEYRHRTISQRFLVSPGRQRVLIAKLAAYALVGIVTASSSPRIVAPRSAEAVVSSKGYTLDLARRRPADGRGHRPGRLRSRACSASSSAPCTRNPTTAMVDDLRRLDRRQDRRRLDRRRRRSTSRSR